MYWIWAGFGFAFGVWLFAMALRFVGRHAAILFNVARWTLLVTTPFLMIAAAFSMNTASGVVVTGVLLAVFGVVASSLIYDPTRPTVTSTPREP